MMFSSSMKRLLFFCYYFVNIFIFLIYYYITRNLHVTLNLLAIILYTYTLYRIHSCENDPDTYLTRVTAYSPLRCRESLDTLGKVTQGLRLDGKCRLSSTREMYVISVSTRYTAKSAPSRFEIPTRRIIRRFERATFI